MLFGLSFKRRRDVGERLRLQAHLVAVRQRAERSAEQDRESVYGRPRWKLDIGATGGLQKSNLDELVQGGPEIVEWDRLRVAAGERVVVGRGEGGVEETRLTSSELEIRLADRAHPAACAGWSARSRAHSAHPSGHALRQLSHRGVADRPQERVAVGKMPV